jgi:hypothetical protein
MLQAWGVVTLADGQVHDLYGPTELLMANWSPDNPIISVVDPDPRGCDASECNLLLIKDPTHLVVTQEEVQLANQFLIDHQ